ncbi:hypothetical protein FACS1894199_14270 [Bacteroidia bacterium]|nr:hypothetical protein FACS1894199_14270 [Bacteroidia bacterium]
MANFSFNPFGIQSIEVEFECDSCEHSITSEKIGIPLPDYSAETVHDSQVGADGYAICEQCGKEFYISVYVTYGGGDGIINDLSDDCEIYVKENPDPYDEDYFDAIQSNTSFLQTFRTEISNLRTLNELVIDDSSVERTLQRQVFIGVIATMETYLSDAFINTTLGSIEFLRRFVETFHTFKVQKLNFDKLFKTYDNIEKICKQAMLDVIYHNLPKVKGMYKDTLEVDLGDIGVVSQAICKRHDFAHRNGKTKKDDEISLSKETISQLFEDIENFIEKIDKQIQCMNEKTYE